MVGVRHAVDEGHAPVGSERLRLAAVEALEPDARAAIALQARIALAVDVPLVVLVPGEDGPARLGADHFAFEAQKAGLDAELGLDKYFFDKAKAAGKPVLALETAESQIDRFDKMPEAMQEQMLLTALAEKDAERTNLSALVSAWQRGDAAAMEKLMLQSFQGNNAAYTSLITERNRNWMPQIEACFRRPSPCFVIVGAAHVIGPDGLLAMLRQKGYRIEQQ